MGNVLLNSSPKAVAATILLFSAGTFAQDAANAKGAERVVTGHTIVSQALPKATLTVSKEFRFAGMQRVNLYGNADAEQYLFIKAGPHGTVGRFYWIQFEHFLPTNQRTYRYDSTRTMQMGGLSFVYDVRSWPNYALLHSSDPASDGAAVERLLAKHDWSLPDRAVQLRMFHLPSADHRSELMIIYGEALPRYSKIPVREGGVELDTESASSAQAVLERARRGLVVRVP